MNAWTLKIPQWREPGTHALRLREWADQGLCATESGDWFPDPNRVVDLTVEKAVCGRCPVREACLAYALDAGESWGIWGGLTPEERLNLIHRLSGITAPDEYEVEQAEVEHDPSQAA